MYFYLINNKINNFIPRKAQIITQLSLNYRPTSLLFWYIFMEESYEIYSDVSSIKSVRRIRNYYFNFFGLVKQTIHFSKFKRFQVLISLGDLTPTVSLNIRISCNSDKVTISGRNFLPLYYSGSHIILFFSFSQLLKRGERVTRNTKTFIFQTCRTNMIQCIPSPKTSD